MQEDIVTRVRRFFSILDENSWTLYEADIVDVHSCLVYRSSVTRVDGWCLVRSPQTEEEVMMFCMIQCQLASVLDVDAVQSVLADASESCARYDFDGRAVWY